MSDVGFTRYKSRQVMAWTLGNLRRVGGYPSVGLIGQPFEGLTVYVVGAGPSLAKNIDGLKGCGPIVCVNASAPALLKAGITPDVLVARESLDISDQIEASDARVVCVDIAAHPAAWTAAGDRLAWFVPGYPRQIEIAYTLREVPIFGGPAALCSAVAIAMRWGAARVVLVGCDLALSDGRAYHPDAPRGTLRYEHTGHGTAGRVQFSGDEQDDERCRRSGQMVPPKSVAADEVIAYDWSRVLPTISVYADQRQWLAAQADRHGGRVELVNATEGGAGVPGWRSVPLAGVATRGEASFDMSGRVPRERVEAMLAALRSEAGRLEISANEMLSEHGPDLRVLESIKGLALGAPTIEPLAASRILDVTGTPIAKIRTIYAALRDAGSEGHAILMGRQ